MTQEELEHKWNTWWVLSEIKKRLDKNPKANNVSFLINYLSKDKNVPSGDGQSRVLTELSRDQVIRINSEDQGNVVLVGAEDFRIFPLQPKFDEVYREYASIFQTGKDRFIESLQEQNPSKPTPHKRDNPKTLKEVLERNYKSFINLDDPGFVQGLADYVQIIINSSALSDIVETDIKTEQQKEYQKLNELTKECQNELLETAKKLSNLVKQSNINLERTKKVIEDYNALKAGRGFSSFYLQADEFRTLCNIISCLKEEGYREIIKNFVKLNQDDSIEEYTFSPTFFLMDAEVEHLKERRKYTVWGAWLEALLIHQVILDKREQLTRLKKSEPLLAIFFEWDITKMDAILRRDPSEEHTQFIRLEYTPHTNRLHNYLLEKLEEKEIIDNSQEPLPVRVVGVPEVKVSGLEEKIVIRKGKNSKIILHQFPKDLRWEEITIRFLNEQEILLTARNDTYQTTYEEMGLQDERRKLPNKQWLFLKLLAIRGGEVSWDIVRSLTQTQKEIYSFKKKKQLLAESLRDYFQINGDPFYSYKKEGAYRIRINLIREQDILEDEEDDLGVVEHLKETSYTVPEDPSQ